MSVCVRYEREISSSTVKYQMSLSCESQRECHESDIYSFAIQNGHLSIELFDIRLGYE